MNSFLCFGSVQTSNDVCELIDIITQGQALAEMRKLHPAARWITAEAVNNPERAFMPTQPLEHFTPYASNDQHYRPRTIREALRIAFNWFIGSHFDVIDTRPPAP